MKLESLADRQPTSEDVGKVVYFANGCHDTIESIIDNKSIMLQGTRSLYNYCYSNVFWNKPIIVSEEEYNSLKNTPIASSNQVGKSPFGGTITLLVAGLKQENDELKELLKQSEQEYTLGEKVYIKHIDDTGIITKMIIDETQDGRVIIYNVKTMDDLNYSLGCFDIEKINEVLK